MDFIEICNNGVYAGLSALQDNPKYQYSISYSKKTYTKYSICEKDNRIDVYNDQGDSFSMDLNDFVKCVQSKIIIITLAERNQDI